MSKHGRLIDADALIKTLVRKEPFCDCARVVIAECMAEVRHAPTIEPEQRWIPVSERLPEKYGWYMCTLKDYRVNTYYWNNKGEWIDNGKKHFFELYNISSRYTGEDITAEQEGSVYWTDWVIAWMPLPEPYRGEGENEPSCHTCEHLIGQPFKPECSLSGSFVDWGRWKGNAPPNCPLRQICVQHGKEGE